MSVALGLLICVAVVAAAPQSDPVFLKLDPELRFQYILDGGGNAGLADTWLKASDVARVGRYAADTDNVYHVFTRNNPTVSQPLLLGANGLLQSSNFDPSKPTIITMHGWQYDASSLINNVLVPVILGAADVNVIAVDWGAGSLTLNVFELVYVNMIDCADSVARFITWINASTGATLDQYHLIGYSISGHTIGQISRHLNGQIPYITSLDPAGPEAFFGTYALRSDDGEYVEVIHTDVGTRGLLNNLGDVDFYPNGGAQMPGCDIISECNHERSILFYGESITSGGFTGRSCGSVAAAITGLCAGTNYLQFGGLTPKTGSTGIYYLSTNAESPFSRG